MFDISYTDWKSVCEMCCNLKQNTCKAYLQWFPFAGLPYQDKKIYVVKSFIGNIFKIQQYFCIRKLCIKQKISCRKRMEVLGSLF